MSTGVDIGKPQQEEPLQAISVRKILLVSSVYDSFIFEGISSSPHFFLSLKN
jgi:hypothetical protein